MFLSSGGIRYSPQLLGDSSSKWWCVVDCDPEIGKYYRQLYNLWNHRTHSLMRPAWKEHITVVRDEEPPCKETWELHAGKQVDFWYNPCSLNNGEYFWLEVTCPFLLDLRESLGLNRNPQFPLHMSIGHLGDDHGDHGNT